MPPPAVPTQSRQSPGTQREAIARAETRPDVRYGRVGRDRNGIGWAGNRGEPSGCHVAVRRALRANDSRRFSESLANPWRAAVASANVTRRAGKARSAY